MPNCPGRIVAGPIRFQRAAKAGATLHSAPAVHSARRSYGVRRQSAAATALWLGSGASSFRNCKFHSQAYKQCSRRASDERANRSARLQPSIDSRGGTCKDQAPSRAGRNKERAQKQERDNLRARGRSYKLREKSEEE